MLTGPTRSNRNQESKEGYNYNEKRRIVPHHTYPTADKIDFRDYVGASARMLLEKAWSYFEGIQLREVEELGISPRQVVKFRSQIKDAILSVLKEPPSANRSTVRNAAVAYLGALEFKEAFEILVGLATSPGESTEVRSLAAEALRRVDGERARSVFIQLLSDPHPVVRKTAVRMLGLVGNKQDLEHLKRQMEQEEDAEVRRRINILLHDTHSENREPETPAKHLSRSVGSGLRRSFGRHGDSPPQTDYIKCIDGEATNDVSGGRDLVAEEWWSDILRVRSFATTTYEIRPSHQDGEKRVYIFGELAKNICNDHVYDIGDNEIVVDLPDHQLIPGRPLPINVGNCPRGQLPIWIPDAPSSPTSVTVSADRNPIWKGSPFGIRVQFRLPNIREASLLQLDVKLPMSPWKSAIFVVSEEEQRAGEKMISGYVAVKTGTISVVATVYSGGGGAARAEARLEVLPANPISMVVYPQTTGTNGEGPAHYNATEDRFYCYARCEVANGFPFGVTVGPNVTCRVTDGGNPVTTFSFSIGTSTIPANSVRSIFLWTWHGSSSNVYDVFEDFGDVRMDFTIQTSQGDITDWNVWAAMAQIRLALNFVGNISLSTMVTFQSIAETEASAILEQQSLYITETDLFVIPSSESDWNRFRDIVLDDNKEHDCTSGSDEADDMRDDWSSPTTWLDVWIVESFSGPACAATVTGFSPVEGPTDKSGDNSGLVIRLNGRDLSSATGRQSVGRTIAHELGHFLGLRHNDDTSNFMYRQNNGTNTAITHDQYRDIADHGFVDRFAL